jgi:hypothetical protein
MIPAGMSRVRFVDGSMQSLWLTQVTGAAGLHLT